MFVEFPEDVEIKMMKKRDKKPKIKDLIPEMRVG